MRSTLVALLIGIGGFGPLTAARAQTPTGSVADRDIAAAFAPILHQGMVGARYDFITNIDFDGDWVGDNNWDNAAKPEFPQLGYVYYAVSETPTHYFIHYAAFHPRDYKGGELTGAMLSQVLRRGARASTRIRQTSIANDVVLAHENDLEGCLVVVKKGATLASSEVVIVETLAHNRYLKYQRDATLSANVGTVRFEGQHPLIYIEPKGHGIEAFSDQPHAPAADDPSSGVATAAAPGGTSRLNPTTTRAGGTTATSGPNGTNGTNGTNAATPGGATTTGGSTAGDAGANGAPAGGGLVERLTGFVSRVENARRVVNREQPEFIRVYRYTGTASDPEKVEGDIGYDLLPTFETMWARARRVPNETYGESQDYGRRDVAVAGAKPGTRSTVLGPLGSSFRGVQGAENKARPPWGWFDMTERDRPLGEWFLDPAAVVLRHFPSSGIDPHYVHQPFLGVTRTP